MIDTITTFDGMQADVLGLIMARLPIPLTTGRGLMRGTNRPIYICNFSAVEVPRGGDYAPFREAALKAGRFSVWEACEKPALFDRLCRDPDIFTDTSCGFPWTTVRLRTQPLTPLGE